MEFLFHDAEIEKVVSVLKSVRKILAQSAVETADVREDLSIEGRPGNYLKKSLSGAASDLEETIHSMAGLEDGLENAAALYRNCDSSIKGSREAVQSPRGQSIATPWANILAWTMLNPGAQSDAEQEAELRHDSELAAQLAELLETEAYNKETWSAASVKEREQILRNLFEEMKTIYGIDVGKMSIESIEAPEGYITYGFFSYSKRKTRMVINRDLLSDARYYDRIMDTMAHEMRHGYQHAAVDHPEDYPVSPETVESWRKNFKDYRQVEDDGYEAYRGQPVEEDARDFAETAVCEE